MPALLTQSSGGCVRWGAARRTCSRHIARCQQPNKEPSPLKDAPPLKSSDNIQETASTSTSSSGGVSIPYKVVTALAATGAAETAYLTLVKLTGGSPVCPVSGCDNVLNSAYSEVFGVPLSALGFAAYASVAAVAAWAWQRRSQDLPTSSQDTALGVGAALLGGVSGTLIAILQSQFAGEPCVWCYTSAAISFSIAVAVALGMPARQLASAAGPGLGATAATVAVMLLAWGASPLASSVTAQGEDFELPYSAPIVTTESNSQAVTLAKRLRDAGAKMYGAFWCSHCYDQKQVFGKQAMDAFPYVECYPDGWKRGTKLVDACEAAGVRAFPTWVINGKVVEGELTLDALAAELSGSSAAGATEGAAAVQQVAQNRKPASPFAKMEAAMAAEDAAASSS